MDERIRRRRHAGLALRLAKLMMAQMDALNGFTIFMGEGMLTKQQLIEVGRAALTLIEEGKV